MSNDAQLEAKLHFFNISSFIRLGMYRKVQFFIGSERFGGLVPSLNGYARLHSGATPRSSPRRFSVPDKQPDLRSIGSHS